MSTSTSMKPTAIDLIDTGRFLEAQKALADYAPATAAELIAAAELALYFGRLGEAEQALQTIGDLTHDIALAARFALAEGELCYLRQDWPTAQRRFNSAYYFSEFLKDHFNVALALYRNARIFSLQGPQEETVRMLHEAYESLRGQGGRAEFLRGLIDFQLAVCERKRGRLEEAEQLYLSAMDTLRESERGRYYAMVLINYGIVERERGNLQRGVELFEEAMNLLNQQNLFDDLAGCVCELAGALIRLRHYERAERLLNECLALHRNTNNTVGEAQTLTRLAQLELDRNRPRRAHEHAQRAVELIEPRSNPTVAVSARINLARSTALDKERAQATELLQQAIQLADEHNLISLKIEALIFLAEAYHSFEPVKGPEHLQAATELLKEHNHTWLNAELQRVAQKYQTGRIWLEGTKLIFDSNLLPNWYDAKRTLEIFLLKNALEQAGQNLTEAGKLLGISKVHVHDKRKQYQI